MSRVYGDAPVVIHRLSVPVDGRPHVLDLTGDIVSVGAKRHDAVDVWFLASAGPVRPVLVRVFATGEPLPPATRPEHVLGTAVTAGGNLVWHLVEVIA